MLRERQGDRFRLEREVGRGGVGVVYRAKDTISGEDVAVKVIGQYGVDASEEARLEREGRILAGLRHPGIVRVLGFGRLEEGQPYVAMEWLEGEDVAAALKRGSFTIGYALDIAIQTAVALDAAHEAGIIHRDIKPSNLFLVRDDEADGGSIRVKIVDFGVAAEGDVKITRTGAIVGTPAYMAPEQARGDAAVDARADLYALGATLFEMLTGRPPHVGPTPIAVLARLVTTPAPRLSEIMGGVPLALDDCLAQLLASQPEDRPASARVVAQALRDLATSLAHHPVLRGAGELSRLGGGIDTQPSSAAPMSMGSLILGPPTPRAGTHLASSRLVTSILATHMPKGAARQRILALIRSRGADATELGGDAIIAHLGVAKALGNEASQAIELGMRIAKMDAKVGIATGRTRVDGVRPTGETVDRAAALARDAERGQLLVDPTTSELSRGRFEFQQRADGTSIVGEPLEAPAEILGGAPFVGREPEFAQLFSAFERSGEDRVPIVATISGASGLGKTRLRRELLARIGSHATTPRVILVRCESFAKGNALGEVADIARGLLDLKKSATAAEVEARLGLEGGATVALLGSTPFETVRTFARFLTRDGDGGFAGPAKGSSSLHRAVSLSMATASPVHTGGEAPVSEHGDVSLRDAVWVTMTNLVRESAKERPLVLAIEDLQWGDTDSLDWVQHALSRTAGLPFFVLGSMRPTFWREHPSAFNGKDHVRVELRPLSQRSVRAIATALLGDRALVETDAIERIADQSGGSPLFAEELSRLAAKGHGGRAPTIEAAIQVQLDALDEEALGCAVKMSIFGQSAWQRGLVALGVKNPEVHLRTLSNAEIIVEQASSRFAEQKEWAFKHALTRDVAYAGLHDEALQDLHARAGQWLADVGEEDAIVARHLELGKSLVKAGVYLERAARHALGANALAQAVELADKALAFAEDQKDIFARALILDEAWNRLDARASERESAIRAMRDSVYDTLTGIRARSARARYEDAKGGGPDTAEELDAVRQAARAAHLVDEEARAAAALAERCAFAGSLDRAEAVCSELLEIAERWGIFSAAVDAWQTLAVVRQGRGEVAAALAARRSAVQAARSARLLTREATLRINVGFALTTVGAEREAREAISTGIALAQAVGSAGVLRHGQMNLLGWAATFGDKAALNPPSTRRDSSEDSERPGALDELLAEPRRLADEAASGSWVPNDRGTLGVLYYRGLELLGMPDREREALTLLRLAATGYRATGMLDVLPVALSHVAEALRKLGDLDAAREAAEEAQHLLDTGCPSLLNEAPVYLTLHDIHVDNGNFAAAKAAIMAGLPRLALRAAGLAGTPHAKQFLTALAPNFGLLAAAEAYNVVPPELAAIMEDAGVA